MADGSWGRRHARHDEPPPSFPPKKGGELFVYHRGRPPVSRPPPLPFYPSTATVLVVVVVAVPLSSAPTRLRAQSLARSLSLAISRWLTQTEGWSVAPARSLDFFRSLLPRAPARTHALIWLGVDVGGQAGTQAGGGGGGGKSKARLG